MKGAAAAPAASQKRGGWRALPVLVLGLLSMLVPLLFLLNQSGELFRSFDEVVRGGGGCSLDLCANCFLGIDLVIVGICRVAYVLELFVVGCFVYGLSAMWELF